MTNAQKYLFDNMSFSELMDHWVNTPENDEIFADGGWDYFLQVLKERNDTA